MTPVRIIWCVWCLFWTALWSIGTLEVIGANPYLWQVQYGNDQRSAACLGVVLALASAAAILAPVGRPSPAWVRQLAAWAWRERPMAQARRVMAGEDERPEPDAATKRTGAHRRP
jgi:hypothetical protein